jgi:hypothetical protein
MRKTSGKGKGAMDQQNVSKEVQLKTWRDRQKKNRANKRFNSFVTILQNT